MSESRPSEAGRGAKAGIPGDRPDVPEPVIVEWPPFRYWVRIGLTLIAAVVLLFLIWQLKAILLVVAASFVLAFGLQPSIGWLERRGVSRGLALTTVMTGVALTVVGFVIAVGPALVSQFGEAFDRLPLLMEDLREQGGPVAEVVDRIDPTAMLSSDEGGSTLATIGTAATGVLNLVAVGVLTPYFAMAFPEMKRFGLRLTAREDRPDVLRLINEAVDKISGFVAGNLVVSVVAFVVSFIAFRLMGLDFALALAAWVGFTDLIPVVGVILGSVVVLGFAAAQGGLELVIAALVFIIVYQQFENYVIVPRIMKRTVDLSPPTVVIAFLAGGALADITGALLALPVAAILKLVLVDFVLEPRMQRIRAEAASGPTPTARRGESPRI